MFSALAFEETPQASNCAERIESFLMSTPFCVREYFWRGLLRCGFSSPCGKNSLARFLFHGSPRLKGFQMFSQSSSWWSCLSCLGLRHSKFAASLVFPRPLYTAAFG